MYKICCTLLVAALISCENKDLSPKVCYLSSEQLPGIFVNYTYNERNEVISSSNNNGTSVTTYSGGNLVSELENNTLETYSYDTKNRVTVWSKTVQGQPQNNQQTKYFYNEFDQDTLWLNYLYDESTSVLHLSTYTKRTFASSSSKNCTHLITYDAASNVLLYSIDYEYDNHPNPYLSNAYFIHSPSNNITSITVTQPGSVPLSDKYYYIYNSNGFPEYQLNKATGAITKYYYYTNCH